MARRATILGVKGVGGASNVKDANGGWEVGVDAIAHGLELVRVCVYVFV